MENQPKINKILFYAGGGYGFRSLLIWFVYEISQVYPTILLSEKLDPDTEKLLLNKNFFPKLEEIVPVPYPSNSLKLMVKNNRPLYETAKKIIRQYKPDIVITTGKNLYPFPLYLRRIAQESGAMNICPLGSQTFRAQDYALWSKLISAHLKKSKFLPFSIRLLLINFRKQIGHFLYYWLLPLMVRETPFRQEPGCVLFGENLGKSADYYLAFSKKDYDLSLQERMPPEKLYILSSLYPQGYEEIRESLKRAFILDKADKLKDKKKILTWMYPDFEIGIKRENRQLISEGEMEKERRKIISLVTETLKDWKIFIKPHPNTKPQHLLKIKKSFSDFSNVEIADPLEWADGYTEISDVILGSPPCSITIYTASLICPEKPILSLDLQKELLGDAYKNFNGVEYIDREEKLINILELIRDNKYHKDYREQKKEALGQKELPNIAESLGYLMKK